MCAVAAPLTADQVLRAFHHDDSMLFLAAAFITVAVLAAALCLIRRRFDPLLIFLAMFAHLYGMRLRLDSDLMRMSHDHNEFFHRMATAIHYLVPIPAFGFFEAAGFLGRRGKAVVVALSSIFLTLVVGTLIFGAKDIFFYANNALVIFALLFMALQSRMLRSRDREAWVLRIGLLCFIGAALWNNIITSFKQESRVEMYGFLIFLASLGYVAARRLMRRDEELIEMRGELETAQRIQRSILPAAFPESPHFRVAARYVPMTSVAGDFYDFIGVETTKAGLLIADVSGHGVPAALIASMVKMAASAQRAHASEPATLISGMNTALCGNTQGQFVTAAYVHLDATQGELRYAAAGHPAMLLLRNGIVSEVIENGFVLGMIEAAEFSEVALPLYPGDRLLLYTDGILEAQNSERQLFGEERLHRALCDSAKLPSSEAATVIIAAVEAWAPTQEDDLTILVCDYAAGDYTAV